MIGKNIIQAIGASCCVILATFLLTGCDFFGIGDATDKAVTALDDAIRKLETSSLGWQKILEETRDKLISESQSTIANEVSNVLSRAIADIGIETRCYTDFLRDRVKEDLIRIRASLTKEKLNLTPVFCKPNPTTIEFELVQSNRQNKIEIDGYNLDLANIHVLLEDKQGQQSDVSFALASPSRYLLTLNLGSNGVPLAKNSNKLIFVLPNNNQSVNIIQPRPTAPPSPVVPVTYEVTVKTGCREYAGTDANVKITIFGEKGKTAETLLDTKNHDDHEKCDTTTYRVLSDFDLGKLQRIQISHDNTNDNPGWFLEGVIVKNPLNGQTWKFPCKRWLDVSEEDGKLWRDIYPGGPCR